MGNEAEEQKETGQATGETTPKSTETKTPTGSKAGEVKTYSQSEVNGLLKEQYDKLNSTLSQQGVELAELRPLKDETENLRATVKRLNDEIDDKALEGAQDNPSYTEVIQLGRTLREEKSRHEANVRAHNAKVAAFTAKEAKYDIWDDQHNLENPQSIASITTKYKIEADAIKDLPKEAREVVAKALAGVQKPPEPRVEVQTPIESGVGAGGQQLTGNAAARAALDKAKDKNRGG